MKPIYFKGILPVAGRTIADMDSIAIRNGYCLHQFVGWDPLDIGTEDNKGPWYFTAERNAHRIQDLRDLCAVQKADGTLLKPFIWAKRRIDTYA